MKIKNLGVVLFLGMLISSNSSSAMIPVIDAVNNQIQTQKLLETLKQTAEMMSQGKTMLEQAETLNKQYNSMVDTVEDYQDYYNQAKKIYDSADSYMNQLKSLDVLKVNGYKFNFKKPSLLQHQIDKLYTSVSKDPKLAAFGKKYREGLRNELAKTAIANAQSRIYQEEDRADDLTRLSNEYQKATTIAEKNSLTNAILLSILSEIQVMTKLQAEMNAVMIGKEAYAKDNPNYEEWDNEDWERYLSSGGSRLSWREDEEKEKRVREKMGF